ncbi:MAG: hypothetical protein QCI00_00560 [Candidatus Thermoplasmatota archaeon]|nr:hypothetical protein [Candidatus Thermoplasmatota archaeon]
MKSVEDTFSNLDFLKDLPETIPLPNNNQIEPMITPKTDLSEVKKITSEQVSYTAPSMPDLMAEKQPKPRHARPGISSIQCYIHEHIARPLIGPPAPGHTTFTIQFNGKQITGFHHMPEKTRSLKELAPYFSTQLKKLVQLIKNRDFKKDAKQLKALPKNIKTLVSKINIDTIKTIPKKLRGIFSSD